VCVLPAFQKSKKGIATPQPDMALLKHLLARAARLVAHRIAAVADTPAAVVAEVSLVRSSVRTRQADLNVPSCGGHSRHYTDWCKLGS